MKLHNDYSGAFDSGFSQEKLSREMLLKVAKAGSDYLRRLDGNWYVTVMKRFSSDAAFDCDVKIWEKFIIYESKSVSEMFGISGNDVLDRKLFGLRAHYFTKAIKVTPLTLPPREEDSDISYRWAFELEADK
jgi:hypothetical protein